VAREIAQLLKKPKLMHKLIKPGGLNDLELKDVKGILIDIDNTLYSYEPPHQKALSTCEKKFTNEFPELAMMVDSEKFKDLYREARNSVTLRLKPNGSCRSRLLAFQEIFESFKEISWHEAIGYAVDFEECYWTSFIENMNRNEEVFNFIQNCHKSNMSICAVSDMQTIFQNRKLAKLGYANFALVTSEEVGVEKPNKSIFLHALNKINLKSNQVIMIGDDYEKDILGARNIGIKAIQISLDD
jgi:HAD superfamily hydrolase (TIGR01509 family)